MRYRSSTISASDPGERQNVAEKYPEKLAELRARLEAIRGKRP